MLGKTVIKRRNGQIRELPSKNRRLIYCNAGEKCQKGQQREDSLTNPKNKEKQKYIAMPKKNVKKNTKEILLTPKKKDKKAYYITKKYMEMVTTDTIQPQNKGENQILQC